MARIDMLKEGLQKGYFNINELSEQDRASLANYDREQERNRLVKEVQKAQAFETALSKQQEERKKFAGIPVKDVLGTAAKGAVTETALGLVSVPVAGAGLLLKALPGERADKAQALAEQTLSDLADIRERERTKRQEELKYATLPQREIAKVGEIGLTMAPSIALGTLLPPASGASKLTQLGTRSTALAPLGFQTGGLETAEAVKRGKDILPAAAIGATKGTLEVGTELLPFDNLMRGKILKLIGADVLGENINNLGSNIVDDIAYGVEGQPAWVRTLQQVPETTLTSIETSLLFGGLSKAGDVTAQLGEKGKQLVSDFKEGKQISQQQKMEVIQENAQAQGKTPEQLVQEVVENETKAMQEQTGLKELAITEQVAPIEPVQQEVQPTIPITEQVKPIVEETIKPTVEIAQPQVIEKITVPQGSTLEQTIDDTITKYGDTVTIRTVPKEEVEIYYNKGFRPAENPNATLREMEELASKLRPLNLQFFAEKKAPEVIEKVEEIPIIEKQPTQAINDLIKRENIGKIKVDGTTGELIGKVDAQTKSDFENVKSVFQNLNVQKPTQYFGTDFTRNIERTFANNSEVANDIIDSFDADKAQRIRDNQQWVNSLKQNVTDKFNFKKGSTESDAIQAYGEKRLTEKQLREKFPKKADQIIEADKYFRKSYDTLIDNINDSLLEIHGDINAQKKIIQDRIEIAENKLKEKKKLLASKTRTDTLTYRQLQETIDRLEDSIETNQTKLADKDLWQHKKIQKRKDYYRHFQEYAGEIEAIKNLFSASVDIDPRLVGISEQTKPKSKFLSLAQARKGAEFTSDAIGGFLDYINAANYAVNINKQIAKMRNLSRLVANSTVETRNANNFIQYLDDFANDLAGKTNPADRFIQDRKIGRTAFKIAENINNRMKANVILGNISSALSQAGNIPNALATIKNPIDISKGLVDTIKKGINSIKGNDAYSDVGFIQERYSDDIFEQFNEDLFDKPRKFAKWMLEALDVPSTKFIYNSFLAKATREDMADPQRYAEKETRKMVAGRGVGELTLNQRSKLTKMMMPFTVEVDNMWQVYKDFVDKKDFAALVLLPIISWMFNKGLELVGKQGILYDPIDAFLDSMKDIEEEDTVLSSARKILGRQAGEAYSNMSSGQYIAALYPEYGIDVDLFGALEEPIELPTREELFGEGDPTRFGTGIPIKRAVQKPIETLALPFGGLQLERTIEGVRALKEGEVRDKSGKLLFDVPPTFENIIKTPTLGKWSTDEAQEYFDSQDDKFSIMPLGDKFKEFSKNFSAQTTAYYPDMTAPDTIKENGKTYNLDREARELYQETYLNEIKNRTDGETNSLLPYFENSDINSMSEEQLTEFKNELNKINGAAKNKAKETVLPLLEVGR